jgi:hypothetical protein
MFVRKILGAAVASALLMTLTGPANADTYVPTPVNQDFSGSQGGWTQSANYSGLCLQSLVCPAVYNNWTGGGADGNGYIRAQFVSLASTLAGTSTSVWDSPAFTYNGLDGKTPGSVTFDMNMLRNVGALLDLSLLNSTNYRVDLVDQATGVKTSVVPATLAAPNTTWQAIPSVSVNPNALKLGHNYKIEIATSYNAVVSVVAVGEVGYDNVKLTTAASNGGGGGGNGGSNITDIKQLRQLTKNYILPKSAEVQGHLLVVHLRCPAAASPKACQIQFSGLQAGKFSKAATARKVVKLKAGKERTVKIRIKPKYVAYYSHAKKIWVKSIVRVGHVRVTVRKRMKLNS